MCSDTDEMCRKPYAGHNLNPQMLNFPEEYKPNNLEGYRNFLVSRGLIVLQTRTISTRKHDVYASAHAHRTRIGLNHEHVLVFRCLSVLPFRRTTLIARSSHYTARFS
jgi:hypothetical protein